MWESPEASLERITTKYQALSRTLSGDLATYSVTNDTSLYQGELDSVQSTKPLELAGVRLL